MTSEGARREEILGTAASLFASSGIRTSLKEIGDACGILPGSLYHHFESKGAIVVELVQRYRDELDAIAKGALDSLHEPGPTGVEQRVVDLGEAIAAAGIRHRAALLLTLYEPPTTASDVLVDLARHTSSAVAEAMAAILEAGRSAGEIRPEVDTTLLGHRICQSMLHVGVGVFHRSRAARHLPTTKCRVFLHGLATRPPAASTLDRSAPMRAARAVIASWHHGEGDDRSAHLRAIGRTEFARRGFEATTMRDVAKAAGLSTGTVYRTYPSKDDLLVAIMSTFAESMNAAWDDVLTAGGTPVERLDALMWVNINVLDRFSDEFKIALAWMRQEPPDSGELRLSFGQDLRRLQDLIVEGEEVGRFHVLDGSARTRARTMYELILTPDNVIRAGGLDAALELARQTVLRGALVAR